MMKKIALLVVGSLLIANGLFAQADTILNRYKSYLFATEKIRTEDIPGLINRLNANGRWSDINYNDKEAANWRPLEHLKRTEELALAYSNPALEYYHQQGLRRSISAALDDWLKNRYKCSNWWHNEIGVPQQMRDIVILLYKELDAETLKGALEVIRQFKTNRKASGANLIWSEDIGLHYALLTGDTLLSRHCRDLIVDEIKITNNDGIQPDYSFHQHKQRLQMYQYGAAFFRDNIRLAWELRNTSLAFPKEKINLLADFLFRGWQWMTRGINTVPGTMDRSVSRKDALHSSDIRSLIPFLMELIPEKKEELLSIASDQNGKGALNGFRYYPYSDFSAYQQEEFSFFLKTISDRTLATESINKENLKGHLLNSGDTYLIRDGKEYFNLMPVWNWKYLPGITAFKGADRIKRKSFVGSVSDGDEGFSSMDYNLETKDAKQFITAKKSWFFYDGKIVSLVADLKGEDVDSAYTTMDQCRWYGNVQVNKKRNKVAEGKHFFKRLKWVQHGNFVYIPLTNIAASVQLQSVSGKWSSINASESDSIVHDKIFMPVLLHANLSETQSFAYMMTYCKTPVEAKRIARHRGLRIVSNDSSCQAVLFKDGMIMAAFFQKGELHFNNNLLSVDHPCMLMMYKDKMYLSDPSRAEGTITIQFNGRTFKVNLPGNGFSSDAILLR
jgi:chondroitin AC lyase